MDIIKTINPICLALSPCAVIARSIHQTPIALRNKTRDLKYNKYTDYILPADTRFADDIWMSFQFFEWSFNKKQYSPDKWEKQSNEWSLKNFGIPANCIRWNYSPKSYVKMTTRKKPSEVIRNNTHLIVICKQTVIGFMDHYYCDGNTLLDYFKTVFVEDNLTIPKLPKYTYYPFISDAMAIQMMSNQSIQIMKYPSQVRGIDDKVCILTKQITKNDEQEWNRWTIYAIATLPIFESIPDVEYLHVGLTVGFDTDQTYGNNRIGMIIVRIIRPKQTTYNERILDLMEQYKIKSTANYTDAHTTYDILRGYDVRYLRHFGMKTIDIVFTALYFKETFSGFERGIGGFVGAFSDYEFLYINAISSGDTTNLTYVSNLKQIEYKTLIDNGMKIKYKFNNNDPTQF
jgi:hypothetical protein